MLFVEEPKTPGVHWFRRRFPTCSFLYKKPLTILIIAFRVYVHILHPPTQRLLNKAGRLALSLDFLFFVCVRVNSTKDSNGSSLNEGEELIRYAMH